MQLSFGMRASSPERFPVYDAWAERFCQRNPGVQMEVLKVAGNLYETYLVRIAAGTPVDVMGGYGFSEHVRTSYAPR